MRCAVCSSTATLFIYREPDGQGPKSMCSSHGKRFLELMNTVLHDSAYRYVAVGTPERHETAQSKWFWIILASLVLSFIVLMSTAPRHIPTEAVEAHTLLALRLAEAPLYSAEYFSAARAIPTENGKPWYGLCKLDGANTVQTFKTTWGGSRWLQEHYPMIDWQNARMQYATGAERMHVSYQKGGQVWWSMTPLALRPGEPLLTDGLVTIRGHCCNQLSAFVPESGRTLPPAHEPPLETFDRAPYAPVPPVPREQTTDIGTPVWQRVYVPPPPALETLALPPIPRAAEFPPVPFTPIVPLEGAPPIIDVGIPIPPPVTEGTTPVPECGTGEYLGFSLLAFVAYKGARYVLGPHR